MKRISKLFELVKPGMRFNRWTILENVFSISRRPLVVKVRCDCGKEVIGQANSILNGKSSSCGCRRGTHRKTNTRIYHKWEGMIQRCYDVNSKDFKSYGGRGIFVCEHWRNSFETFLEDMGPRPSPKHSIDRFPDNNGNYEPGNCRWATAKEQARNRRNNRTMIFNGQEKTVSEWAEIIGVQSCLLFKRIKMGWPNDEVLTTPINTNYQRRMVKKVK